MTATASHEASTTATATAVDPAAWFADLVQRAAADGLGDVYVEVRTGRFPPQLLAWTRPLSAESGYTALTAAEVPTSLATDPQATCDGILTVVGLNLDTDDAQTAQRQMQVDGQSIEVRMVHTPSAHGCRLALRMTPARRTATPAA